LRTKHADHQETVFDVKRSDPSGRAEGPQGRFHSSPKGRGPRKRVSSKHAAKGRQAKSDRQGKDKPNGWEDPAGPIPDQAKSAPDAPQTAQEDAAEAFMKASSTSQVYTPATAGLLSTVKFGLPDRDVYFKVKPIETVKKPDGSTVYKNVANVWLYSLPRGAKMTPNEPNQYVIDETMVSAFQQRKARVERYQLRLAVDKQGTPYIIPVPMELGWAAEGTRKVVVEAETRWVKQYWDQQKGRLHDPADEQTLAPTWPVESFAVLYMLAVGPIYIKDKEHEIYRRLCGA
jgi:hypothetical protein